MTVHVFSSSDQLSSAVGNYVADLSAEAIQARGRFVVALSGGSLPNLLSAKLIIEPLRRQIDWSAWHVFFADERCVPLDHGDSNYRLAKEQLFDHVAIPPDQIYTINPPLDPEAAATTYQTNLLHLFSLPPSNLPTFQPFGFAQDRPSNPPPPPSQSPSPPILPSSRPPRFDLILLGLGEDGHTASLFPGHKLLDESKRWVAPIFDSPKPPPERITLTLPLINNARHVAFVTSGASKAEVLPLAIDTRTVPAGLVAPREGTLDWFVDEAAAESLKESSA